MFEKECRCRSWSDIRGRNLVLGICTLEDSLAFLVILSGEKGGGIGFGFGLLGWGLGIGDWGLGIGCRVQGPIWVLGDRLVGWEWLGVVEQCMCWWRGGAVSLAVLLGGQVLGGLTRVIGMWDKDFISRSSM